LYQKSSPVSSREEQKPTIVLFRVDWLVDHVDDAHGVTGCTRDDQTNSTALISLQIAINVFMGSDRFQIDDADSLIQGVA